ncbi:MAG TPA: VCBS repeat-containing protein [Verrucomicrobiae bacterium]|nr:VCBS repeat-containing protein [Verrucomicrobiae bacterium]
MISANFGGGSGNTLTVLTNNGSGSFGSNATYTVGAGPFSVVAADVNGDGKLDLISANVGNYNGNTLTVLTNNGSGNFCSNATYTVGADPISVVAADVNGDGKLDLITANNVNVNTGTLTVLTNNGDGGFGFNATYTLGVGATCVIAADVKGDGKVDLITANQGYNTLTVLTNNGSGVFGSNATYTVDTEPFSVTAADVKGDGKLDLISANYGGNSGNTLTVLTNNGSGGFGSNATYTVGDRSLGIGIYYVAAADVNGDGKPDLISTKNGSGTLSVLTNDGSGGFVLAASPADGGGASVMVMAADLNNDGKADLICASGTLSVLINTTIFPSPTSTPSLSINPSGNGMSVSWPSVSAGWSLQQNPDLTTANWSPSGYSGYGIADDGMNKSLIITPLTGNLFFRLLHP